jgi:hypothetical protein
MNLKLNKFLPAITGKTSSCHHYECQSKENALRPMNVKQNRNVFITYKYTHFTSQMINYSLSRDSIVGIAIRYCWTTERSEFESRWGQDFSLLFVVQIGSAAHPTSYLMGTVGSFPGAKADGA